MTTVKTVKRIAYLGPEGTFTHQALDLLPAGPRVRAVPYPTVPDVMHALEERDVDAAIVPIENSIEGAVTATLDGLAFGRRDIRIEAEVLLPIHFDLFVSRGTRAAKLKEVLSHPHAIAQCRKFISTHRLVPRSALSTAEACRQLRDQPRPGVGAIASSKAGELYGLTAVRRGIEDVSGAVTRFVYLRSGASSQPTGQDKTSLVLTPKHDRPGSLVEVLQEFSSRRINLSRIESRPLKTELGRYCFFIDAAGHIGDPLLGEAVRSFSRKDVDVKFLGSYPSVSNPPPRRGRPEVRPVDNVRRRILTPLRRVGVIGLGLIGGSIAKALSNTDGVSVCGFDTDAETRRRAARAGMVCAKSITDLAARSELIVIAAPIEATDRIFRDLAGVLRSTHLVTDVGSVKGPVLSAARTLLPRRGLFIGGHPMAGSERTGFEMSRADLFRGSAWVLTVDARTDPASFLRLAELVISMGARVVPMRPAVHDEAVSVISHLPHALAYSLVSLADDPRDRPIRQELAAGSFRDLVRVSGAPPEVWAEIFRVNRSEVRSALGRYIRRLTEIQSILDLGQFDRLRRVFEEGHRGHQRLRKTELIRRTLAFPEHSVRAKLPGILSTLTARCGRIEEISVESGRVRLSVTSRRSA